MDEGGVHTLAKKGQLDLPAMKYVAAMAHPSLPPPLCKAESQCCIDIFIYPKIFSERPTTFLPFPAFPFLLPALLLCAHVVLVLFADAEDRRDGGAKTELFGPILGPFSALQD
jgi:hypothetical protein